MILFPNAKINLGLNIINRRSDGYHNIETVMYPVKWCDILEIVPAKSQSTTLSVTGRNVDCPTEKNLVMKAFRLFKDNTGIDNVDIYLHKIIPDGAGLGGGSADAAFTLTGLNKMFECNIPDEQLAIMAAQIGADCPFFIHNRPMLATGIGTCFSPVNIDLSHYTITIVKPQSSVPTAKAYAGVTPKQPERNILETFSLPIEQWGDTLRNDFECSVFPIYPEIRQIKNTLHEMGALYTSMSGSGSAVYGIFKKNDNLAERLKNNFPHCDCFTDNM